MNSRINRITAITIIVLSGVFILLTSPATCQESSSPVFIIYGIMYQPYNDEPMDQPYTMMAENKRNNISNFAELGAWGEPGKFSIVLIDYDQGNAVQVGDTVVVRAKRFDESEFKQYASHIIEEIDIQKKMKQISFQAIAVESQSWGAIKLIFEISN